jgi:hypothetical protein
MIVTEHEFENEEGNEVSLQEIEFAAITWEVLQTWVDVQRDPATYQLHVVFTHRIRIRPSSFGLAQRIELDKEA